AVTEGNNPDVEFDVVQYRRRNVQRFLVAGISKVSMESRVANQVVDPPARILLILEPQQCFGNLVSPVDIVIAPQHDRAVGQGNRDLLKAVQYRTQTALALLVTALHAVNVADNRLPGPGQIGRLVRHRAEPQPLQQSDKVPGVPDEIDQQCAQKGELPVAGHQPHDETGDQRTQQPPLLIIPGFHITLTGLSSSRKTGSLSPGPSESSCRIDTALAACAVSKRGRRPCDLRRRRFAPRHNPAIAPGCKPGRGGSSEISTDETR